MKRMSVMTATALGLFPSPVVLSLARRPQDGWVIANV